MSIKRDSKTGEWYYHFRYTDSFGKVHQRKGTGFKTQKEAKERMEIEHRRKTERLGLSYREVYQMCCEDKTEPKRQSTLDVHSNIFEKHILPYFGDMCISDITKETIYDWQRIMKNKTYGKDNRHYKDTYLKTVNNQLSAVLNYAVSHCDLKDNPCTRVGIMGSDKSEVMQFWTEEEFKKVVAMEKDILFKTLFYFLFYSGCRIGEALALTINNFDFDNNSVFITKTLSKQRGKSYLQDPKTEKSRREIVLPSKIMDLIQALFDRTYDKNPDNPIFPVGRTTVRTHIDNAAKKAGIKRIRIHDFRHSHASLLIERNEPINLVADRLGHENPSITLKTYSHVYSARNKKLAEDLDKSIGEISI